ncbi:sugar ABC transporter substrate-binding protein, partial [Kitasatospora sp. NPDC048296]
MKRRLLALSAATVAGTLALSGCSKGSASGSTSADGVTTIKFVAADYGSNGQNPSQAYWQGVI